MKFGSRAVTATVLAAVIVALAGCHKQEGPAERAGKELDKSLEKVGQQMEKAGEKIQDAARNK